MTDPPRKKNAEPSRPNSISWSLADDEVVVAIVAGDRPAETAVVSLPSRNMETIQARYEEIRGEVTNMPPALVTGELIDMLIARVHSRDKKEPLASIVRDVQQATGIPVEIGICRRLLKDLNMIHLPLGPSDIARSPPAPQGHNKYPAFTDEQFAMVYELRRQGKTWPEIAEYLPFDIHPSSLSNRHARKVDAGYGDEQAASAGWPPGTSPGSAQRLEGGKGTAGELWNKSTSPHWGPWTAVQDTTFACLRARGLLCKQIAPYVGRSAAACMRRIQHHLPSQNIQDEELVEDEGALGIVKTVYNPPAPGWVATHSPLSRSGKNGNQSMPPPAFLDIAETTRKALKRRSRTYSQRQSNSSEAGNQDIGTERGHGSAFGPTSVGQSALYPRPSASSARPAPREEVARSQSRLNAHPMVLPPPVPIEPVPPGPELPMLEDQRRPRPQGRWPGW